MILTPVAGGEVDERDAAALGLAEIPHFALLCLSEHGEKWSMFGTDLDYGEFILEAFGKGLKEKTAINLGKFPWLRLGFPEHIFDELRPESQRDGE